jgi:CheY-like chemotaxis protein
MQTILILEDSDDDRTLLEYAARKSGIDLHKVKFEYVTDGGAALGWLYKHPRPVLIITDNNMSPMNGVSFVDTIKSLKQFESIPVAMLTGHVSDPVVQSIRYQLVSLFDKNAELPHLTRWLGDLVQRCI